MDAIKRTQAGYVTRTPETFRRYFALCRIQVSSWDLPGSIQASRPRRPRCNLIARIATQEKATIALAQSRGAGCRVASETSPRAPRKLLRTTFAGRDAAGVPLLRDIRTARQPAVRPACSQDHPLLAGLPFVSLLFFFTSRLSTRIILVSFTMTAPVFSKFHAHRVEQKRATTDPFPVLRRSDNILPATPLARVYKAAYGGGGRMSPVFAGLRARRAVTCP
ncbi:hypothetical protein PsYK624_151860 [Phanerochaete sordida]|uniref:Uncharacterized protein n=1 Tax=Phanerochaete sordida TaxID=48140 RepID=A0A9P3GPY6_9APHY|nr:hypothetical protein PsYK624_151860 [Phanerochaete sordida]